MEDLSFFVKETSSSITCDNLLETVQDDYQVQWWVHNWYSYGCHILCMSWQMECIFRSVLMMMATTKWNLDFLCNHLYHWMTIWVHNSQTQCQVVLTRVADYSTDLSPVSNCSSTCDAIHFWSRHCLSPCPIWSICSASVANWSQNLMLAHYSKQSVSPHWTFIQCALLCSLLHRPL
jgi:hypothetical protein